MSGFGEQPGDKPGPLAWGPPPPGSSSSSDGPAAPPAEDGQLPPPAATPFDPGPYVPPATFAPPSAPPPRPTPPGPADDAWQRPPAVPLVLPYAESGPKTGAIVAGLAAVLLIGAMAFMVVTKDSSNGSNPARTALSTDADPGAGSKPDPAETATTADLFALQASLDPLAEVAPTVTDVSVMSRSDVEGAEWTAFDETFILPGEVPRVCAAEGSDGSGSYSQRWELGEQDGQSYASVGVLITQFDSVEAANASVVSRSVDTYRSCYLDQIEDDLRLSTGGGDVAAPVVVRDAASQGPDDAMVYLSTSEDYRMGDHSCTKYIDATWQQFGDRVVSTKVASCETRIADGQQQKLADAIARRMNG